MKQKVSPVAAVCAVVALVGLSAWAIYSFTSGDAGSKNGQTPPGMPADVSSEFSKRMGSASVTGASAPGQSGGSTTPMITGPGNATAPTGGGK